MVITSPPIVLVNLGQVKRNLRLSGVEEDEDLEEKMAQATAMVLERVVRTDDTTWNAMVDAWTVTTVPRVVQAQILRQVNFLYRFRGDDEVTPETEGGLAPGIDQALKAAGYSDHVLA